VIAALLSSRTRVALILVLATAFVPLAACSDERYEAERASAAFTTPVHLAAVPPTVQAGVLPDASRATVIGDEGRLFSLGAPDGDERYLFGEIADIALSPSGDTVYVLDRMERQTKAFSRDGRFLFRFGRKGKGPGEYNDPASIAFLPWNGQVAVWDVGLQRLTFVTPAGETAGTAAPLRQNDLARMGKKLRAWREGFVLELRDDPLAVPAEKQRGYLVRLDTLGRLRDTMATFAIPGIRGSGITDHGEVIQTSYLYAPHWTPEPTWDLLPDGEIVLAPGGRYEVYRLAADGAARYRLARPWTPARLNRHERMINLRDAQENMGLAPQVPTWFLEPFHRKFFARIRPSITGVLATTGGGFAAERFNADDDPTGRSRTWDEYRADGQPWRTVRFPAGFQPRIVTADRVYGLRRDTLKVDYLEAFRR
jgi:hypothetical protein